MSEKTAETVSHAFHMFERTETGKRTIHVAGAAAAGAIAAIPIAGPLLVVAAPLALLGWGLWTLFGDAGTA